MRDFNLAKIFPGNQTICTNLTEHARDHFVTAGAVMAVQQNNFRDFFTRDLIVAAQA
ncbi:hypothetical protein D3C76_1560550 [compost metagenome]